MRQWLRPTSWLVWIALAFTLTAWAQAGCGPMEVELDGQLPDGGVADGLQRDQVGQDSRQDSTSQDLSPTDQSTSDQTNPEQPRPDGGQEPLQDGQTNEAPLDEISKPAFLQPTGFSDLQLDVKQWTLPAALAKDPLRALEVQSNGNVLFGATSGLYETTGSKVTKVAAIQVVGIAPWKTTKMVVAEAQKISLWDGALASTKLFDSLDGSDITAIKARTANSIWIGTKKSLWLLTNDIVREFNTIKGVKSLEYTHGIQVLLITDQQDQQIGLELAPDGRWQQRDFSSEGTPLQQMAPHPETPLDFWGLDATTGLYLRKVDTDNAAWWPFRLKPDANEDDTIKISALVFHPKPDTTWGIGTTSLYRLSEKTVGVQARPTTLGSITYRAGATDGGLWLSDGKALFRIGQTGPAVSYAKDVEPIIKASCIQCHAAGGRASFAPFTTYAQVKAKSALIISRINLGNMPPSGPLPKAKIDVIQNWINGGYQP